MKLWGSPKRPAYPEDTATGAEHQAQPTVLDLQHRPEAMDIAVSGEVQGRLRQAPSTPIRLVAVLGRGLVHDIAFCQRTINIGRDSSQDIHLDHPSVSRGHCQIRFEDDIYAVYDMGTANGTTLNGRAIAAERLTPGDEVGVGSYVVLFEPTETQLDKIDYRIEVRGDNSQRFKHVTRYLSSEQISQMRKEVWEIRSPHLKVIGNARDVGVRYILRSRTVLGRGHEADVPLAGWTMARRQAEIFRDVEGFTIRPLARWRTVYVNGAAVVGQRRLTNRDMVSVGRNLFQFSI